MGYEFGASGGGVDWAQETNKLTRSDFEREFIMLWELGRDRAVLERAGGSHTIYAERERRERGELLNVFSGRKYARGRVRGWCFEGLFHTKWSKDERIERRASRYGSCGGDVYER